MADIEFDGVVKRFPDGTEAVRGMDLHIGDGQFMILVGPSGCGKSTALRMIAGLEEITEGELRIGGEVVNDVAPRDRDIAMVFQNYALYPQMTVRQNMGFALRLRHVPKEERERRVLEAARTLGLEEYLDRKPSKLSGGQRQRVAMGRALVREPAAFLMDEPLSNLDAKLRVQTRAEISRLQQRLGTTTIYVTHDQTEAMTLGDRVAVMRSGVLEQVDTPRELYANPVNLFVAGFIGSPAMNFFDGELAGGSVRTPLGELPLSDELRRRVESAGPPERRVIVGIRPEDFDDAELADDAAPGFVFEAAVELAESVGSDLYVHFSSSGPRVDAPDLEEALSDESRALGSDGRAVARVDPASRAHAGAPARLRIATDRIHLFDRADGRAITAGRRLAAAA
jgi:multiple sugar transport system ATP-binding protein